MNELLKIRDRLLQDLSYWKVKAPKQDVFMIGNGKVSAVLGWGERLTDMGWVLGPYYENDFNRVEHPGTSYFGTQTARLFSQGIEVNWPIQLLGRVRQTCITVSSMKNPDGLKWDTIDFCSADQNILTRIMIFENENEKAIAGHTLNIGWQEPEENRKAWSPKLEVSGDPATGTGHCNISLKDASGNIRELDNSFDSSFNVHQNIIKIEIPALLPGKSHVLVQSMAITVSSSEGTNTVNPNPVEELEAALSYWKNWSNAGAHIRSSEAWFDDLIDAAKVWCKVQQSSHGVFTPMIFYSDAYVRDCNGPVRLFLRLGMFEEVKGVLDFFRKAAMFNHRSYKNEHYSGVNNIRLDVAFFPDDEDIDWSRIDPGKAEIPSLIILWHWWYFLQTGDLEPVRKNWSFLVRCLESQKISEQGLIGFHGDETYKYLGVKEMTGVDQPQYVLMFDTHENTYSSFESTVLFLNAFEAMSSMAGRLGVADSIKPLEDQVLRMKQVLEDSFWDATDGCYRMASGGDSHSFSNPHTIALSTPCWLDAFEYKPSPVLNPERAQISWKKCLNYLDNNGWQNAAPYLPVTDGHLPGFMLCGAAIYDPSRISHTMGKIKAIATPAGGFAELYTSYDPEGARGYHGKAWGRLRPWESGINAESMLFALSGIRFEADEQIIHINPSLAEGWDYFEITNFRLMNTSLSLRIEKREQHVNWNIKNDGNNTIKIIYDGEPKNIVHLRPGEVMRN